MHCIGASGVHLQNFDTQLIPILQRRAVFPVADEVGGAGLPHVDGVMAGAGCSRTECRTPPADCSAGPIFAAYVRTV